MGTVAAVGTVVALLVGVGSLVAALIKAGRWWRRRDRTDNAPATALPREKVYLDLLKKEHLFLNTLEAWAFRGEEAHPGEVLDQQWERQQLEHRLAAYGSDEVERLEQALESATADFVTAMRTHWVIMQQGGGFDATAAWREMHERRRLARAALEDVSRQVRKELASSA